MISTMMRTPRTEPTVVAGVVPAAACAEGGRTVKGCGVEELDAQAVLSGVAGVWDDVAVPDLADAGVLRAGQVEVAPDWVACPDPDVVVVLLVEVPPAVVPPVMVPPAVVPPVVPPVVVPPVVVPLVVPPVMVPPVVVPPVVPPVVVPPVVVPPVVVCWVPLVEDVAVAEAVPVAEVVGLAE